MPDIGECFPHHKHYYFTMQLGYIILIHFPRVVRVHGFCTIAAVCFLEVWLHHGTVT